MCHYVYEQNAVNTAKIRLITGVPYRPISKLLARTVCLGRHIVPPISHNGGYYREQLYHKDA